jgi:hypothetical protein
MAQSRTLIYPQQGGLHFSATHTASVKLPHFNPVSVNVAFKRKLQKQ